MKHYLIGIAIGAALIVFSIVRLKKMKQELADIDLTQYTKISFYKSILIWIILLVILGVVALVYGIVGTDSGIFIIVGIAIIMDSFAELYLAKETMVFYYNDTRCIIDNKQVIYKNIKYCMPKSTLPFSKGIVELYNGERKDVFHPAIALIKDKMTPQIK